MRARRTLLFVLLCLTVLGHPQFGQVGAGFSITGLNQEWQFLQIHTRGFFGPTNSAFSNSDNILSSSVCEYRGKLYHNEKNIANEMRNNL